MNVRLSSLAAAIVVAAGAQAAEEPEQDNEVLVIGQRLEETLPQQLERLGNRLETVTRDDIDLGGYKDLGQTLQMETPGLFVAPEAGPFDYIQCSMQGSRCQDVLFLVDGVRINNRLYKTTTTLDTFPAHAVERIEVLYGGQGVFYGTQAMAGLVNIVTHPFTSEPTGRVHLGFAEFGGRHAAADFSTSFGNGHSIVLYGSYDQSDGFQTYHEDDRQPSATDRERGYEALTVGGKYGYEFSFGSRLSLFYQHTDNRLDFLRAFGTRKEFNDRVEDIFTVKFDHSFGDKVDFYIKGYYHDWDSEFTRIRNVVGPDGQLTGEIWVQNDADYWGFEDYGVTAMADIRATEAIEFSVGYDFQRYSAQDDVWQIDDRTETVNAVYGQIRSSRTAFENSDVAFGVRYNTMSGNASNTVWNLGGRHDFHERFYVRGQIGTSFRLPDAEELYVNEDGWLGNPDLEPEEGENLELGIGGLLGRGVHWQLIYFARDVDNLIQMGNDGVYMNTDQTVEFRGWEVAANAAVGASVSLDFSYTSNEARAENSNLQLATIPESLLKAGLRYRPAALPLELGLSLVYVGDTFSPVVAGSRRAYGDYTVVDVAGSYFFDSERRHRLGLRIANLFDEDYVTRYRPGTLDAGGSYAYRQVGMPRMASVSYDYRW